jgi:ankyrin repeat protein
VLNSVEYVLGMGSGKAYCMPTRLLLLKRNGIGLNTMENNVDRLFPSLHNYIPLMIAAENPHEEAVRALLGRQDEDPSIKDKRAPTPQRKKGTVMF